MLRRNTESPIPQRHNRSQHLDYQRRCTPRSHTVHHQNKLKVFLKFKPDVNYSETPDTIKYLNSQEIQIKTALKHKIYKFDQIFSGKQGSRDIFKIGCKDLIDHVLSQTQEDNSSNNGLIFVYGNTGTGKTYSMGLLDELNGSSRGIVPDSMRYIFSVLGQNSCQNYMVSISFCEIYMDEVFDLLALENDARLIIRQDSPFLDNEMTIQVKSLEQAFQIINIGLDKRRIAQQKMNRRSSRGHGLITLTIDPQNGHIPARLCLIDLAGCERLKESESKGSTLNQALHINSSLSSLETLLMNISEQRVRNYRASKLTRILQPYFERGRINLFVTATKDSVSAVEFAKRCKGIRFMEKDLRLSTIPARRSTTGDNVAMKALVKELQELSQFKVEAEEKQKAYQSCIQGLVNGLKAVSGELQKCLKKQKHFQKFSLSDIMKNVQLQQAINRKLQGYQSNEQHMLQQLLFRLSAVAPPQIQNYQNIPAIQQLTMSSQHFGLQIQKDIKQLGDLIDYRTVYRKEFFTSQFKLHLLQKRCNQLELGVTQLIPYLNSSDKRITRKLKELGISADTSQNSLASGNRATSRKENNVKRTPLAEKNIQEEEVETSKGVYSPVTKSGRREAIFIDDL